MQVFCYHSKGVKVAYNILPADGTKHCPKSCLCNQNSHYNFTSLEPLAYPPQIDVSITTTPIKSLV